MRTTGIHEHCLPVVLLLLLAVAADARAAKTDVVTLRNGDRITGEVKVLERGRLEFSTDDAGTIYLEWDKLAALTSPNDFEVRTQDGRLFVGSLRGGVPGTLVVFTPGGAEVALVMWEVTEIHAIGRSFWKKLDGSADVGFSYTRSSEIAQLNVNGTTVYRKPSFEARLSVSATITRSDDEGDRDDRGTLQASYLRYRGKRLFVAGGLGFESNESLGLKLRTQLAFAAGPRLVNSNRAQLTIGAGIAVNEERHLDSDTTQNVEAILTFRSSYFRYDTPKTNVDVGLQYFPSLSDIGRHRVQLDATVRRELFKDFFVALNVFDTYDSRPPSAEFNTNDVGVVLSFGWSF
jgi:hypothetical protein